MDGQLKSTEQRPDNMGANQATAGSRQPLSCNHLQLSSCSSVQLLSRCSCCSWPAQLPCQSRLSKPSIAADSACRLWRVAEGVPGPGPGGAGEGVGHAPVSSPIATGQQSATQGDTGRHTASRPQTGCSLPVPHNRQIKITEIEASRCGCLTLNA